MNKNKILIVALAIFLLASPNIAQAADNPIEEVVVKGASLSPLAVKHLSSSVTILTQEDIAASGQPFLIDVLRRVPGIAITQSGGAGSLSDIRIRGGESDHTKVLINGIEVNDTSSAQFDFGHLSSSQIERVEIIRGSQSLIHGANATGGVIAITTKTGRGDLTGDYQADGGSFGTWHGAVNFGGGGKNFSFGGGLDIYNSDGHDVSSLGRDEKDDYRNYTAHMRVDWFQDDFKARFSVRHVNSKFNGDSFFPSTAPDGPSLEHNDQTELGAGVSYDRELVKSLDLHNEVNLSLFSLAGQTIGDFSSSIRQQRLNIHYKTSLNIDDRVDLALLLGWEEEELNQQNNLAEVEQFVAGEGQVHLWGFDLTAGVRGEFYNNSENGTLWRLTAARDLPFVPVRVHGSYGTSINKPTLYDLYGFSPASYCSNPDLKLEKSDSWDVGLDVDAVSFVRGLTFGATAFGIDTQDEFQSVFGFPPREGCPEGTTSSIVNEPGRTKRRGAELEAEWQVLDDLFLSTNYTYTRAKRADGTESLRRPKHIWSLNLSWKIWRFSLGGDMSWTSSQQDVDAVDFSTITTPSYFLFNLHGSYAVNEKLDAFVRLENITDESTTIHGYDRRGFGAYAGIKGKF